jgi:hypothetical protein
VAECDHAIEAVLASLEQAALETALPVARYKGRPVNEPSFNVRAALFQLLGTDLTQLYGFGAYTALMLIGECGVDMTNEEQYRERILEGCAACERVGLCTPGDHCGGRRFLRKVAAYFA